MITKDSPCLVPLEKAYFFSRSRRNNRAILPARLSFNRPHSTKQDAGQSHLYSKSLDSGAIFASQKYFPTLVLFDWCWVYAVPGTGSAFFLLCQVSFSLATALFQLWLRIQPTKLPFQLPFWPKECQSSFQ